MLRTLISLVLVAVVGFCPATCVWARAMQHDKNPASACGCGHCGLPKSSPQRPAAPPASGSCFCRGAVLPASHQAASPDDLVARHAPSALREISARPEAREVVRRNWLAHEPICRSARMLRAQLSSWLI